MKWVLITPDTLIHPRAMSSTTSAYVIRLSPRPPNSSGIVSPKTPSSLSPSMISVGYSSACSSSWATGMICSPSDASTETPSETPSAAPVEPVDFGTEPAVAPKYKKAALRATSDDLITMVPSTLPEGWTTVGGGYQPEPQWWRMEFTAPTGDVVLDQLPGTSDEALADQPHLVAADDVDLSAWGTGAWSAWDHDGATVLAHDLKGSTVVIQGPDLETVRGLA